MGLAKIPDTKQKRSPVRAWRTPVHRKLAWTFVRYFVPHKHNDYRPLFLRVEMVAATAALIVILFIGATAAERVMIAGNSPQVAAVVVATLVDLANTDRTTNDLSALTVSPLLTAAAQAKANDEAAKGYFAHNSPDGHDPWYWFSQAGYSFSYAGENLAVYFSDSAAVNTAWMNSPEHRANILNGHFTEIGIATAEGMYQGQQTIFVVQEFGTPASIASAPGSDQTATVPSPAKLASARSANGVAAVKGASTKTIEAPVTVIKETPTFIAVESATAPAPSFAQPSAGTTPTAPAPNGIMTAFLKLITSPQTDLILLYEIIGVIITLALVLEVVVEARRRHPHRLVMGLSLISLMLILVYAGHTLLVGQLLIL